MTNETQITQTNGQVATKTFIYSVNDNLNKFKIAVIAQSATVAKEALRQQLSADASISFIGIVDKVMQVNG